LGFLLAPPVSRADTVQQHSGWAAWFNSDRLNDRWGYVTDVQLRSGDDLKEAQNLLVRPGLTYFFDGQNNATLGYALVATLNNPGDNLIEHRIWQQYIHTQTWSRAAVTHRFRLEQRFVEQQNTGDRLFSQRLRYFFRSVVPLKGDKASFTEGPFFAFQNELFLNVQHEDHVNGKLFDQNRLFLAGGYRLSSRYDLELGYLNQSINGRVNDTVNHIVQVGLYSRF
jgi:hypothetical protein